MIRLPAGQLYFGGGFTLRHLRFLYFTIPVLAVLAGLFIAGFWYFTHDYLEADVSEAYAFDIPDRQIVMSIRETEDVDLSLDVVYQNMVERAARRRAASSYSFEYTDPSVVSMDGSGKITPHSVGTTDVTVRFAELSDTLRVTVFMPIDDIRLRQHDVSLNIGQTQSLDVEVVPEDATLYEGFRFMTADPSVAKVSEDGKVTAVFPGETWIYMESHDYRDACRVRVYAPLERISFVGGESDITLERGNTYTFRVGYYPEYTTDDRYVIFTSSNESVGRITADGVFTALGAGNTTITARVGNCIVTCIVRVQVSIRRIFFTTGDLVMRSGDSVQIPLSYEPIDFTVNVGTVWQSSNPAVVSVTQDGTVTARDAGTATITAQNGYYTTSMNITVVIPVTGVAMSDAVKTVNRGDQYRFEASVLPLNTTEDRTIYWSSDNTSVATVDGNGVMTAVGRGTAHITALHGNFSASCTVTVLAPITEIRFEQPQISLMTGSEFAINILFDPIDTTDDRTVFFTVEDPSVGVVDGNILKTLNPGTTRIAARVGTHYAYADLTVIAFVPVERIVLSAATLSFSGVGQQQSLSATVYPVNATNSAVAWWSEDPSVAVVSGGVVTSVGPGTCRIWATSGSVNVSCTVSVAQAARNIVVVLDPGHNDRYTGASYHGFREETLNLRVAQLCKAYLEAHYTGVTVRLTRTDGTPLATTSLNDDLLARARFAQDVGAEILVSMHFNATANHNASGCLVFASMDENVAAQCAALGNRILSHIAELGLYNRGVIVTSSNQYFDEFGNPMDYYAINRYCAARGIPGIIVEHCFLDVDTAYLTDAMMENFAIADALGIAEYLGLSPK